MKYRARILLVTLNIVVLTIGIMAVIAWKSDYGNKVINLVRNQNTDVVGYYSVTAVYDGDTIGINMSGKTERIRLIGVDTPETKDPDLPIQCYGPESSAYTESNLLGKEVRLESDPTNQNRDRYDRLLRYVYLKDGVLWNLKLIEEGYGFAYLRYPFKKLKTFEASENYAKSTDKGLWKACSPSIVNGVYRTNSATSN